MYANCTDEKDEPDLMDLALVHHEFPPYFIGGVGSYTFNLAHFLSKRKVHTTVYCGRSATPKLENIGEYLDVVRLPLFDVPLRAYWFQIQNFCHFSKELARHEIIHAISPQSATVCVVLKDKLKRPVVTTVHNIPIMRTKTFMQAPLSEWSFGDVAAHYVENAIEHLMVKYCMKRSDKVVMVSNTDQKLAKMIYKNIPAGKIVTIQNGIDFEALTKLKAKLQTKAETDSPSVVFFGRLIWPKGITYLIKAMAILRKEVPDVELRVIGKGPMLTKLFRLVARLHLVNNVRFLGFFGPAEREKLVEQILGAHVISLPSMYEPMANLATLEAMACEKPIVAFDLPFIRDVIMNMNNGLLARPADVEDLAEKIRILLIDKDLRRKVGRNAWRYVKVHHDVRLVVDKYLQVYKALSD